MALVQGTRFGPFEITGKLGAGGMGEVYRARDTKLGREVAIKTLPSQLASDKERLARFNVMVTREGTRILARRVGAFLLRRERPHGGARNLRADVAHRKARQALRIRLLFVGPGWPSVGPGSERGAIPLDSSR